MGFARNGFVRGKTIGSLAALLLALGVTGACSHTSGDAAAPAAEGAAEGMPDVPMLPMEIVTANSLNVRSLPSTKGTVLGTLKKGQEVRVMETKNGWKRVQSDGTAPEGWVAGEFLKAHEAPKQ
ncbi:MAG TPA: SH3 domain-containing protein [Myxococcota bacterium]|nr:SH3 domain-containing protein [Myxococcota bacterium]